MAALNRPQRSWLGLIPPAALPALLAASLLLVPLLLVPIGCRIEADGPDGAPPSAAPDFTLSTLDGGEVQLAALRGRTVIVDFWATWCAPCVHQIPVLNAFQAAHPEDVVVLGISVDTDGPEVVAEFAREHQITYPVLLGSPDLAQRYGAFGFPSLYVITPEGTIDTAHVGVVSEEELEEALSRILAL